ncbi:MAG: c-type cytochrome, partial [Xanthomonadales bacterium]|nr:c-type cytochrome [Xanthomonadales bacterium]NIX11873.1 c-type cytochrome [Xanthomonadales bacterium]
SDYRRWVTNYQLGLAAQARMTERDWSMSELMSHGETVYGAQCATCHQADGQGLAPAFPPLAGSQVAIGPLGEHIQVVL